jgi:hypothetical protein
MDIVTHLDVVDLDRVRKLFVGVEQLAAEGRRTKNPQVLLTALRVLGMQARTVAELGVRV